MRDNLYSRFVAWSKILLPLGALALLSTVFLLARDTGPDPSIPFADIEEIAREPRIAAPRYAGVAGDGSTISVSSQTLRPDPTQPDRIGIAGLQVRIETPEGMVYALTAREGEVDGRARVAQLTGLARLTISNGYEMETAGLETDLASGEIRSLGALAVRAPFGALTAGQMTISRPEPEGSQQMVFSGGVRLLYLPQEQGSTP